MTLLKLRSIILLIFSIIHLKIVAQFFLHSLLKRNSCHFDGQTAARHRHGEAQARTRRYYVTPA